MGKRAARNIILIGFSYTGKSQAGRKVAERLGWEFIDTDDEITRRAGKSIPRIFAEEGEEHFRKLEREVLREACEGERRVISTGGGAILFPENRELMRNSGIIICLEAKPETIYRRLLKDAEEGSEKVVRPLLSGPDPLGRIYRLKQYRQPFYGIADWTVHTDNLTLDEVCEEIIRGFEYARRKPVETSFPFGELPEAEAPYCPEYGAELVVRTPSRHYPVFLGWGVLGGIGRKLSDFGISKATKVFLVSDEGVFPIFGEKVRGALLGEGFDLEVFVVPQGEESKSLQMASRLYDFLTAFKAERRSPLIALGGGVVGDLAGFVAATFLRGIPLIHVPTSLVAMADSSIGGKAAVDHPRGKNLIGAFYQPLFVLSDLEFLPSLPRREFVSGWAEIIKHALIQDRGFFEFLEENAADLLSLRREKVFSAVRRSIEIKAEIVSRDEREETGLRSLLNLGHTIGHGIEAASGYRGVLHGEAVAVGMRGAALISEQLGLLKPEVRERIERILKRFGLPLKIEGIDAQAVLESMELDKKVREGRIRWILLEDIGRPLISHVPAELVKEILSLLLS